MRAKVLATLAILIALGLAACSGGGLPPLPQSALKDSAYRLGPGDKLKVTVFGAEDLSGDFQVADSGALSFPLIGDVRAVGLTSDQLARNIETKLSDGFMRNPKVAIEVTNYRPVYVMGEVTRPGEYPYSSGMTVLNAIALGGGYSYRANQHYAIVTRNNQEYRADGMTRIMAGDVVRVPERYF